MNDLIRFRRDDVAFRTVGHEGLLIKLDSAEVVVVNAVAARIVELLDAPRTVAELSRILASEYEVSADDAAADVERFVSQLVDDGVLGTLPQPADRTAPPVPGVRDVDAARRAYMAPSVSFVEPMELIASACTPPTGKGTPTACPSGPLGS